MIIPSSACIRTCIAYLRSLPITLKCIGYRFFYDWRFRLHHRRCEHFILFFSRKCIGISCPFYSAVACVVDCPSRSCDVWIDGLLACSTNMVINQFVFLVSVSIDTSLKSMILLRLLHLVSLTLNQLYLIIDKRRRGIPILPSGCLVSRGDRMKYSRQIFAHLHTDILPCTSTLSPQLLATRSKAACKYWPLAHYITLFMRYCLAKDDSWSSPPGECRLDA